MYDIQSKSDFKEGATLTVRIPEKELDKKALYTILAEKPSFVLPFRHRVVDGQIEFIYQVGNRSKLDYLSGNRVPSEYADLWFYILQPLLDCGDWFMNPYSFVLKSEYLYCEKNDKSVSFVYIPSVKLCSDYNTLKGMVVDIARNNHVTDVHLENKVVWAIQDFNPSEFLKMVGSYKAQNIQKNDYQQAPANMSGQQEQNGQFSAQANQYPSQAAQYQPESGQPPSGLPPVSEIANNYQHNSNKTQSNMDSDNIAINFSANTKSSKSVKKLPSIDSLFGSKKTKDEKPQQEAKGIGLFGSKKLKDEKSQYEPKGVAGLLGTKRTIDEKPQQEPRIGDSLFGSKKKSHQQEIIGGAAATFHQQEYMHNAHNMPKSPNQPAYPPPSDIDDAVTQLEDRHSDAPKFRYVGIGDHPGVIEVNIAEKGFFSIGRFDPSVGIKQSSFEFNQKTKAVSRHHAVVARSADGYFLEDLYSAAGTFINGHKLPPNAPFKLIQGYRVSFGHLGADYVWEE